MSTTPRDPSDPQPADPSSANSTKWFTIGGVIVTVIVLGTVTVNQWNGAGGKTTTRTTTRTTTQTTISAGPT